MGRWLLYAGLGFGLLCLAAGYIYCAGAARGVWAPSDVLRPALTQMVILGVGWALVRGGRRTLGTALAVVVAFLLAFQLGCALALVPGAA
jgi:hypothetical protein